MGPIEKERWGGECEKKKKRSLGTAKDSLRKEGERERRGWITRIQRGRREERQSNIPPEFLLHFNIILLHPMRPYL